MPAIFYLIDTVLGLFLLVIVLRVIFSWLISFEVLPTTNPAIAKTLEVLYALTEPAMNKVRRVLPMFAGIDFSPLVLIIGVQFLRILVNDTVRPLIGV